MTTSENISMPKGIRSTETINHLQFLYYISYHLQYMELLKRKSIKVHSVMRQDGNPNWNARKSGIRFSSMNSIKICASVSMEKRVH